MAQPRSPYDDSEEEEEVNMAVPTGSPRGEAAMPDPSNFPIKLVMIEVPFAVNTRPNPRTKQVMPFPLKIRKVVHPQVTVADFLHKFLFDEIPTEFWKQFPGNKANYWAIQSGADQCFQIKTSTNRSAPLQLFQMVLAPKAQPNTILASRDLLYDLINASQVEELQVQMRNGVHTKYVRTAYEFAPFQTILMDKDDEEDDDNSSAEEEMKRNQTQKSKSTAKKTNAADQKEETKKGTTSKTKSKSANGKSTAGSNPKGETLANEDETKNKKPVKEAETNDITFKRGKAQPDASKEPPASKKTTEKTTKESSTESTTNSTQAKNDTKPQEKESIATKKSETNKLTAKAGKEKKTPTEKKENDPTTITEPKVEPKASQQPVRTVSPKERAMAARKAAAVAAAAEENNLPPTSKKTESPLAEKKPRNVEMRDAEVTTKRKGSEAESSNAETKTKKPKPETFSSNEDRVTEKSKQKSIHDSNEDPKKAKQASSDNKEKAKPAKRKANIDSKNAACEDDTPFKIARRDDASVSSQEESDASPSKTKNGTIPMVSQESEEEDFAPQKAPVGMDIDTSPGNKEERDSTRKENSKEGNEEDSDSESESSSDSDSSSSGSSSDSSSDDDDSSDEEEEDKATETKVTVKVATSKPTNGKKVEEEIMNGNKLTEPSHAGALKEEAPKPTPRGEKDGGKQTATKPIVQESTPALIDEKGSAASDKTRGKKAKEDTAKAKGASKLLEETKNGSSSKLRGSESIVAKPPTIENTKEKMGIKEDAKDSDSSSDSDSDSSSSSSSSSSDSESDDDSSDDEVDNRKSKTKAATLLVESSKDTKPSAKTSSVPSKPEVKDDDDDTTLGSYEAASTPKTETSSSKPINENMKPASTSKANEVSPSDSKDGSTNSDFYSCDEATLDDEKKSKPPAEAHLNEPPKDKHHATPTKKQLNPGKATSKATQPSTAAEQNEEEQKELRIEELRQLGLLSPAKTTSGNHVTNKKASLSAETVSKGMTPKSEEASGATTREDNAATPTADTSKGRLANKSKSQPSKESEGHGDSDAESSSSSSSSSSGSSSSSSSSSDSDSDSDSDEDSVPVKTPPPKAPASSPSTASGSRRRRPLVAPGKKIVIHPTF